MLKKCWYEARKTVTPPVTLRFKRDTSFEKKARER